MTNGFGKYFFSGTKSQLCQVSGIDNVRNWMASGEWVSTESGTGFSPLSESHRAILCLLVLRNCSGQRLDKKRK